MSDTKDLLRRALDGYSPEPQGVERVGRAAARRDLRRRAIAGLTALVVAGGGLLVTWDAFRPERRDQLLSPVEVTPSTLASREPPGEAAHDRARPASFPPRDPPAIDSNPADGPVKTGGYVFSDFRLGPVGNPGPRQLWLFYKEAWAGTEFPGERDCTWQILTTDGAVIGEASVRFMLTVANPPHDVYSTALVRLTGEGTPHAASVECSSTRRDDPTGHYDFKDIRVGPGNDLKHVSVSYTVEWVGAGRPSPMDCVAKVFDAEGTLLGLDRFAFYGGSDERIGALDSDRPHLVRVGDAAEATSAAIDCKLPTGKG